MKLTVKDHTINTVAYITCLIRDKGEVHYG